MSTLQSVVDTLLVVMGAGTVAFVVGFGFTMGMWACCKLTEWSPLQIVNVLVERERDKE